MEVAAYKKVMKYPLRPRTLTFLIKDGQVLLGLKKKGFGMGYWLGIGGKVESNESIEDAAKRELQEEINVSVAKLTPFGVLNFYFPHVEDESWNQQVHVFVATNWNGEPQESEEIKPVWFDKAKLPFDAMWDDAHYWLPSILASKRIEGEFIFDQKLKVVDQKINLL